MACEKTRTFKGLPLCGFLLTEASKTTQVLLCSLVMHALVMGN